MCVPFAETAAVVICKPKPGFVTQRSTGTVRTMVAPLRCPLHAGKGWPIIEPFRGISRGLPSEVTSRKEARARRERVR